MLLQTKLAELDAEIKALVKKAGELGEEGDVDGAQNATNQAESLKVHCRTPFPQSMAARAESDQTYVYTVVLPTQSAFLHAHGSEITSYIISSSSLSIADAVQVERITTEEEARQRAQDSVTRYGEQEVCPYSGVIVNREESRLRDHKAGRNYR